MEGGNYDEQYGHNVWGGQLPQETVQDEEQHTTQQNPYNQQWHSQVYQGFQQQYSFEVEQLRRSMQEEHALILENERQKWNTSSENLKDIWREEAKKAVEREKETFHLQISSFRSVFQQQLLENAKEIADLQTKISLLEVEKALALQEVELVSNRFRLRIQELEHMVTTRQREFELEKDRLESEIAQVLSISDHRGMEIQKLQHKLLSGANQESSISSVASNSQPIVEQRHEMFLNEDTYLTSASGSGSVVTARAGDPYQATGPINRISVLRTVGESGNLGKSHHKLPTFNATGSFSAHQWLRQFEKLINYYSWDEHTALMEMQISMTGEADTWFLHLPENTRNSLVLAKAAFQTNFGGEASVRAKAVTELQSMKKGGESMETFGPRIKSKILKVLPGENELSLESHLSMLFPTLNEDLVNLVSAQRPRILTEAIDIAMHIERGRSFASRIKGAGRKGNALPIPMVPSTGNAKESEEQAEAMDIDAQRINAQQTRGSHNKFNRGLRDNHKGSTKGKSCFACKKMGHIAKDCYLVRQVEQIQKKNDKSYRSNSQKITAVPEDKGSSNIAINDAEFDITNNLFYQVGGFKSNSQILSATDLIPTFVGGSSDPRSFGVVADTENDIMTECLMDTGAMMSSITEEETARLGLVTEEAPKIRLCYGNESVEYSETSTRFSCCMGGYAYPSFKLRVVKKQNVPIILGMDWILQMDILLNPKHKALLQRRGHENYISNNTVTIDASMEQFKDMPKEIVDVLLTMPSLYDESEVQTITNAPIQHTIDTGDAAPVVRRRRRVSPKEDAVINEAVDALLEKGVLQPSKSAWCSTTLVVPKPDGTNRFVNNFRGVNAVTVKDKYPLPRMDDLIDQLAHSSWYCTIDLKSAYFQIPLAETSRPKTAFATSKGFYEYTVMAQGLCNSPATFSRFMDHILREVKSFTIVYLDDVLCHAKTREESIIKVTEVLRILYKWNLKVSLKKYRFLVREVPFLGFIISGTGIKSNPEKVAPIQSWPTPANVNELQQFLGICTFYHRYIANLSKIASPLYFLLKKDAEWKWNEACQQAFLELKVILKELPELAYPDTNLPYDLHCDASNFAMGAVFAQNGRPIAYASKTFTPAEKNYSTTEKECLAVAWSLEYFHCYVH